MASTIKVNNIQNQCGANIANKCGTTITLGASGDTITLACGASQTGFGRTGTVNWDTTAKTASFTAVSGNGYFVNTTSGAITVTMPASPSAGDIVGIKDYAGTFATNNVTVGRNGSNFDGAASDPTLSTNQLSVFFVYVDGTQGWKATQNDSGQYGALYVTATGGTVTTCGDYKIHTFTSPGTFCVSCAGNPAGSTLVDYLVVAGGGGGAANGAGGGGGGGYRESSGAASGCYTASPLGSGVSALPVTASPYPITVGGGGTGVTSGRSTQGSNSVFSTITSAGGGETGSFCSGASYTSPAVIGGPGGSGGGGGAGPSCTPNVGCVPAANKGSGNTPPVSPPQGNDGGRGLHSGCYSPTGAVGGGGGGGAGGTGGEPVLNPGTGGTGGVGVSTSITGSPLSYSGGGGGGIGPGTGFTVPAGSPCGTGGAGGRWPSPGAVAGTTNRGGGGGGGGHQPQGGANGGSGVVIIRYKYQ